MWVNLDCFPKYFSLQQLLQEKNQLQDNQQIKKEVEAIVQEGREKESLTASSVPQSERTSPATKTSCYMSTASKVNVGSSLEVKITSSTAHGKSPSVKSAVQPVKQPLNVLGKRQFSVPKFPHRDPTAFDPNSTDHSVEDSPVRPRKRKVVDKDADADNLDDLIASLKRVAQRDMKPNVFEKIKKKASSRNIPVESFLVEKLSLLNMPKRCERDDDDLESLGSVDTDMAPASETSRDLECTYSDLESVNESVSSRDILSTSLTPVPPEVYLAETSKLCSRFLNESSESEHYKSEAIIKISGNDRFSSTPSKNRRLNSSEKVLSRGDQSYKFDILPVEKLEAMIAELDQVISDTDSNEGDPPEPPAQKFPNTETKSDESPDKKETSHFTLQEIHVPGEVNFAKAAQSIETPSNGNIKSPTSVSVSSVETKESRSAKVELVAPDYMRSRSLDSSCTPEKVSNLSFIPSSDKSLPVPENATLVTLISRPTSEESLSSKKFQETIYKDIKAVAKSKTMDEVSEFLTFNPVCGF